MSRIFPSVDAILAVPQHGLRTFRSFVREPIYLLDGDWTESRNFAEVVQYSLAMTVTRGRRRVLVINLIVCQALELIAN